MELDSSTVIMYSENHGNLILKSLQKLWEDDMYCDVTLKVGDSLIAAHRVILCAGSRYFYTMLTSGLKESNQSDPIELQSVDEAAAKLMVRYMYTGEMQLNHKIVEPALYTADMFDIPEAVNLCCRFLMRSLTPYNSLYTLRLADMHNNKDLYNAALDIVSSQFTEVVKSADFLSSPPNQAADLLKSDSLNVKTEIPVLQGAFAWLKYNNLLRDYETNVPSEGAEGAQQVEPLSPAEEKLRQQMTATIRYPLLPLKYLQGLSGDIVATVCHDQIKYAIRQRKCLPQLREHVKMRSGMHFGKIYIAGGAGSSLAELSKPRLNLEVYDPLHDEWAKEPEPDFMTHCPHVGVLSCVNGYVYVIGGSDSSGKPGRLVHRLNIVTGVWEQVASLITSTTKPGVCVQGGMTYVAGGWNGTDPLSTFERYEPATNTWKKLRNMNRCRMEFPLVTCRDKVYAVCGNTTDYTNVAQSLEVYDPLTNGWTELMPTIRPRWCPGAAAVRDYIFICGLPGKDRTSLGTADKHYTVERFSPATGQWSIMPALSNAVGGACLTNIQNTLFVLGGSDGTAPLASCSIAQRYDADHESWTNIPSMNVARVGASVTVT